MFGSTWYARRPPEMAVRSRAFSAPARVALALTLAATLCVSADARRLDARRLDARHARGCNVFARPGCFSRARRTTGAATGRTGWCWIVAGTADAVPGGRGLPGLLHRRGRGQRRERAVEQSVFRGAGLRRMLRRRRGRATDGLLHARRVLPRRGGRIALVLRVRHRPPRERRAARAGLFLGRGGGRRDERAREATRRVRREDVRTRRSLVADAPRSEDVADGQTVEHEVSPEVAFAPAEEADVNDPTYGAFARLDPGGES